MRAKSEPRPPLDVLSVQRHECGLTTDSCPPGSNDAPAEAEDLRLHIEPEHRRAAARHVHASEIPRLRESQLERQVKRALREAASSPRWQRGTCKNFVSERTSPGPSRGPFRHPGRAAARFVTRAEPRPVSSPGPSRPRNRCLRRTVGTCVFYASVGPSRGLPTPPGATVSIER